MKKVNKEKLIPSLYASLLVTLTLLLFGPLNLYFTNILELNYKLIDVLYLLLLITFISFILTFLISLLPIKKDIFEKIVSVVFSIGVLLWFQGNILVRNYGVFDGKEIIWGKYTVYNFIDGFVWISIILLFLIKSSYIIKNIKRASIFLIVLQSISIFILGINVPEQPQEWGKYSISMEPEFSFSPERNVIVLVLDTFQSDVFKEILDENSEYYKIFNGFTYFKNSLGGYPTTAASAPLILTGQYYDNSIPYNDFIKSSYINSSINKILIDNGYDVSMFPYYSESTIYHDSLVMSNLVEKTDKSVNTFGDVRKLYNITFFRYSPQILKRYFHDKVLIDRPNSKVEKNKNYVIGDVEFVNRSKTLSKLNSKKNTFKFYHLRGVHPPFNLNEQLEYEVLGNDYEAYKTQAKASVNIATTFLKTLKEIGIYDNSLIFIIGDHGYGSYGLRDNYDEVALDKGISYVSDSIIASGLPLVLVKPFNDIGNLDISYAPISLSDIPRTIAEEVGIDSDLPGISMFKVRENDTRERRFLSYTWEHEYWSKEYLPVMKEYIVTGFSWLAKSWKPTYKSYTEKGVISNRPELYKYGTSMDFSKSDKDIAYKLNGWSSPEENFTWTEGNNANMLIPIDDVSCNLILKAKLFPFLAKDIKYQRANIYVNGEKVANWKIDKAGEYTAEIPKEIVSSPLQISFELPDAVSPLESGVSEDPRVLALAFNEMVVDKYSEYEIDSIVRFGIGGNAKLFQKSGWSNPEDGFTWNDGERASITIPIESIDKQLELKAKLAPFTTQNVKMQKVIIYMGDEKIGEWEVDKDSYYSVNIPSDKIKDSMLNLEFEFPYATSPKKENISADERELSVRFMELLIDINNSQRDTETKQ